MSVICLARHPAVQIRSGVCYGQTDVPLSAGWEAFADRLAARMRHHGISRLFASPLARCRLPAERVAQLSRAELRLDERLREISFGSWEGRDWSDVPRAALDEWAADLAGFAPPGGESGNALIGRVQAFWADCPFDEPFAILSHGGPLRILAALAPNQSPDLSVSPLRLGEIDVIESL